MRSLVLGVVMLVLGSATISHADAPKRRIELIGNLMFTGDELRAAIQDPYDATGAFNQEILERDLLLIAAFYWDRGHAQVKVHEPKITRTAITIEVEEGPTFTLDHVLITGDPTMAQRAKHLKAMRSRKGQLFSRTKIADDRERLSLHYQDLGYAFVNVLPLTKVDLARRTITLTFEVTRGKRATVERVDFDNTSRLPDSAFQPALTIAAGERYSATRLEQVKAALLAVGVANCVISTKRGATDTQIIITYEVSD
jgi:outer membrane protein insertion porin family